MQDSHKFHSFRSRFRFGFVSHVLPPSPSGQAVVIGKLLSMIDPRCFSLFSRSAYHHADFVRAFPSASHPVRYFKLAPDPLPAKPMGMSKLSSLIRLSPAMVLARAWQLMVLAKKEKCRCLIACSGDPYDIPASWLAANMIRIPFIAYYFDDFVYQWTGVIRYFARIFEPIISKTAACVIVPNEFLRDEYRNRYAIEPVIMRNPCATDNMAAPNTRTPISDTSCIKIAYTGSIYRAHYDAFRNLIEAISNPDFANVQLQIYSAQSHKELEAYGIGGPRVFFRGHVSNSEVPKILKEADILFLPLAFKSQIQHVIKTSAPGKTGEYLASGTPILVHAPQDSYVSYIFRRYQCGYVVDENSPESVGKGLSEIIHNKNQTSIYVKNALRFASEEFDIFHIAKKFINLISGLNGNI